MRYVDVNIGTDGKVSIDAVGFSGPSCKEFTKELERVLGTPEETKTKPEYRRRVGEDAQRIRVGHKS